MQGAEGVRRSWGRASADLDAHSATAVLAALSFWDYAFVADVPGSDAYKATGRCISVAAGRISFTYNFKGRLFKNFQIIIEYYKLVKDGFIGNRMPSFVNLAC